jgi:hypothetical protein
VRWFLHLDLNQVVATVEAVRWVKPGTVAM